MRERSTRTRHRWRVASWTRLVLAMLVVAALVAGVAYLAWQRRHPTPPPTVDVSLAGFPVVALIDGERVDAATVALRPGSHTLASADPLLTFPPTTLEVPPPPATASLPAVVPALTPEGIARVRSAASASLAACLERRGLSPSGCPNVATPPPGLILQDSTVAWALAREDPTASLDVKLEPGRSWGTSPRLTIPLRVTAEAIRRYDGTTTRYDQPLTVAARVQVSVADGKVTVVWME